MKYIVYTDGACSGNPGKGGYAYIAIAESDGKENVFLKASGNKVYTTNNEMELTAICRSLKTLLKSKDPVFERSHLDNPRNEIIFYSDSAYCINPINQKWLHLWAKNNWRTSKNEELKNSYLWKEIYYLLNHARCNISFVKVKGHAGNKYNELVDRAAKNAILRLNDNNISKQGV